MKRTPKIIVLGATLLGAVFIVHRLWVQYQAVPVVVGVERPVSPQMRETLDQFAQSNNVVRVSHTYEDSIPYDVATDKKISPSDLSRIRRRAAWSFWRPHLIELIVIHDASNVTVHVKDKTVSSLQFTKQDGHWKCEVRRGHVDRMAGIRGQSPE